MRRRVPTLAALALAPLLASGDEGTWTFDAFPSAKVEAAVGGSRQAGIRPQGPREVASRRGGFPAPLARRVMSPP